MFLVISAIEDSRAVLSLEYMSVVRLQTGERDLSPNLGSMELCKHNSACILQYRTQKSINIILHLLYCLATCSVPL
jgi:hypothetical protein